MSSKLRVYEVARDLGMDNKELVTLLQSIGFSEIKNHMSVVPSEAIDRAKRQLERKNEPNKVVEERIRPTVVKRRTAVKRPEDGAAGAESSSGIAVAPSAFRDGHRTSDATVHRDEAHHAPVANRPSVVARQSDPRHADVRSPEGRTADAGPVVSHEPSKPMAASTVATSVGHSQASSDVLSGASPKSADVEQTAAVRESHVAESKQGAVVPSVAKSREQDSRSVTSDSGTEVAHAGAVSEVSVAVAGQAATAPKSSDKVETAKTEPTVSEPSRSDARPSEQSKSEPTQENQQGAAGAAVSATSSVAARTEVAAPSATTAALEQATGEATSRAVGAPNLASTGKTEAHRANAPKDHGESSRATTPKPVERSSGDLSASRADTAKAEALKPQTAQRTGESQGATRVHSPAQAPHASASPNRGATPSSSGPRVISSPAPGARPSTPPGPSTPSRPSSPPRTGIEVWEGRPGVPMSPAHRAPVPRRVQYDAKAGANAMQRRPGQPAQRMARGTRGKGPAGMGGSAGGMGRGGPMGGRQTGAPPATQERGAHKRVVKIEGSVGLQTLANSMGVKAHELLRKLIMLGMTGVNINSTLDADTAKIVATEFGWDVSDVAVTEEQALVIAQGVETEADTGEREPRPPVVTVMGHVDHGKTSLLDRIRKANVAGGEAGGITQHIGAYSVDTARGKITFLDTPGHEAFTAMRMRGAQTTDIVILVVAADDGVMPQTREAVNHAKLAKVPLVVAINKCDKPEAQPDRCRRELAELGLVPEEWGGDTLFTEVSAQTGKGVDELLERVLLQAEMLDLRANPNKLAVGVVIEAQLDRGRGPVATMLVTDGTLKRGDVLLVGAASGKVRAMLDSSGRNLAEAGPSTPVEVIGLNDVPAAGDPVHVVKDLKKAQELADSRKIKERRSLMPSGGQRLTLEELYKAMKETEQLELKVIVKADVHGSVEAVSDALVRLSTEKVKVTVVHTAAGAITEGDVNLAVAAGAIIIGFNVRPAGKAASLAAQEKVEIRQYNIIYNVVDDVKAAMEGLLSPSLVEKVLGQAQVRQVFRVSKAGNVAGCMVTQGLIRRAAGIRIMREGAMIWSGKMSALKRFKDDAREVKEGFDCGISLDGYQDIKEADILECFEMEEVRQTL